MTLRLAPAGLADLWRHLVEQKATRLEHEYRLMVGEILSGRVWSCLDGDIPIAIGGVLIPEPTLPGTAWLSVLPELGSRVVPLALMMRRGIRLEAERHDPGVVCAVRDDNLEGQRLAALLGFRETDRRVVRLVEWRWHGGGRRDGDGTWCA